MVARISGLERFAPVIPRQSDWQRFLDVVREIFTVSLWTTRRVDGLPEDLRKGVRDAAQIVARDPQLRADFIQARRDFGSQADSDLQTLLGQCIQKANPRIDSDERDEAVRLAYRTILGSPCTVNAKGLTLDLAAPMPSPNEGVNVLAMELEGALRPMPAVKVAQHVAFRRVIEILHSVLTPVDTGNAGTGVELGLAALTMGVSLFSGRDEDRGPGVLTGKELGRIAENVRYLPTTDQHLIGVMLKEMTTPERRLLVLRDGATQEQVDALVAKLGTPTPAEVRAGTLLAGLAGLDLALSHVTRLGNSGSSINEKEADALCVRLASDLTCDWAHPTPASLKTLAQEYVRNRLAYVTKSSPGVDALKNL